jgi:hypothetical protein
MAYKITKYAGKHKIKDTKTGKSAEIDIDKYMDGGKKKYMYMYGGTPEDMYMYGGTPEDMYMDGGKKEDNRLSNSRKLDEQDLNKLNKETGVGFSKELANRLFEVPVDQPRQEVTLDYGKYKDVEYFDSYYNGDRLVVRPTSKNPQNAQGYTGQLDYLKELNPDADFSNSPYRGFEDRNYEFEDGGSLPKYALGTTDYECGGPGQPPCPPAPLGNYENYVNETAEQRDQRTGNTPQGDFQNYVNETPIQRSERLQAEANQKDATKFNVQTTMVQPEAQERPNLSTNEELMAGLSKANMKEYQAPGKEQNRDFNILNPYTGVDIPTSASMLGQSIENKDAFGIVTSGLKTGLGLARNVATGVGQQKTYNRVMEDYYEKQKDDMNIPVTLKDGGKLEDSMLATGDYMRGNNLKEGQYNAEIEKGEYFQTGQGEVAEVLGDKHSQGGEKIQMQPEDRVLSDNLKLGAKTAKMIRDEYGITVKAKHTYSDVLDKLTQKIGLKDISKEEAKVYEKINKQTDTKDKMTRDMNLEVLSQKAEELKAEKGPLTMQKQEMFDRLYAMQEGSKPKSKEQPAELKKGGQHRMPDGSMMDGESHSSEGMPKYALGGEMDQLVKNLAMELNISEEEAATFLESQPRSGAKNSYATGDADEDFRSQSDSGIYYGAVTDKNFEEFRQKNDHWYDFSDFDPRDKDQVMMLQEEYNKRTPGNKVKIDGLFGEQTVSLYLSPEEVKKANVQGELARGSYDPLLRSSGDNMPEDKVGTDGIPGNTTNKPGEDQYRNTNAGLYTGYYGSPLPPTALQGTIKPERRFEREKALEVNVDPYIQDIYDQQNVSMRQLESLSPSARAAAMANVRGNTQSQTSKVRNQIDNQNITNAQGVNSRNAGTQRMEENAREADRLGYEQRQYRAQALTDNDRNNYYNNMQDINKQKYMDVYNLNLANSSREDYYFDGERFRRKTSKSDLYKNINTSLT